MIRLLLLLSLACLFYTNTKAQARIVVNNDAYVVMDGGTAATPIYVVLDNPNSNGVTTLGTGGNWVSEGEHNKLRWRIAGNTGAYQIPFTTENDVKIPYEMNVTGAGAGGTHIDFSTYPTNVANVPYPTMVNHMAAADGSTADNSDWVIDRFWISDALNYTTRPSSEIVFGYDPDETTGNSLTLGNMVAQRYRTTDDTWGGSTSGSALYFGVDNFAATQVENAVVPSNELWQAWTLVDDVNLLPVELLYFNAECRDTYVNLTWATATEKDADFFVVEKTLDGEHWTTVEQLAAQGNSNSESSYQVKDYNPRNTLSYYRLRQVDFDGKQEVFEIQSLQACGNQNESISVNSHNNGVYQVTINADYEETFQANLLDLNGKQVRNTRTLQAVSGENIFLFEDQQLSTGIYMLTIESPSTKYNHKILIQK